MERQAHIGHVESFLLLTDAEIGRDGTPWSVIARLSLPSVSATTKVHLGSSQEEPLGVFFDGLARDSSGWTGIRTWQAYEEGLTLNASVDALGHVTIGVELREGSGGFGWLVRGDVPLDVGQLEQVARDVHGLFAPS